MQFKWLLFDADNTLLDFDSASKLGFKKTYESYNLPFEESVYKAYKKINAKVWEEFEDGKITAIELRPLRFARFFEYLSINPCHPGEFNAAYLRNLINTSTVYKGIPELLAQLSEKLPISMLTNGLKEVQRERFERLQIDHFFSSIVVSDEIGFAKPDRAYFDYAFKTIANPPPKNQILMIGDSLNSDMKGGANYGLKTCWINCANKPNETDIQIDYEMNSIPEMINFLKKLILGHE